MSEILHDCNLDLVIDMQEMGVGVEEIVQYARDVMDRDEVRSLLYGLEKQIATSRGRVGVCSD